jgi:hypothetical protein
MTLLEAALRFRLRMEVKPNLTLRVIENFKLKYPRICASSGTTSGRGGPFGADSSFVIPAQTGIQVFPWKREYIVFKWFPAFAGTSSGLRLEFIPMKIGAGVTDFEFFIRTTTYR